MRFDIVVQFFRVYISAVFSFYPCFLVPTSIQLGYMLSKYVNVFCVLSYLPIASLKANEIYLGLRGEAIAKVL